jgi:putative transcriptional regulator
VEESLRGQLLVAAPQLVDYFRRTVVLLLEHSEDGAMGLVLGRASEAPVAEAVPKLADLVEPGDHVLVGGPVQPDAVLALADFEDPDDAGAPVAGSLGLLDPDLEDPCLRRLRVFAGYAGWAPGQLEQELEEDAWVVVPAEPDDPFEDGDLWPRVLARQGGALALLATMPADPSLN